MKPLDQQVIVITGASSGIGRCTARVVGENGAKVVLAARGAEALQAVAQEIASAGSEALVVPTDAGAGDSHQAGLDRHAVLPARAQQDRRQSQAYTAGLRSPACRRCDPPRSGPPARTLTVGGFGGVMQASENLAPSMLDREMAVGGFALQESDKPEADGASGNLFAPSPGTGSVRGGWDGCGTSLYTWLELHPEVRRGATGAAAAAALLGGVWARNRVQ